MRTTADCTCQATTDPAKGCFGVDFEKLASRRARTLSRESAMILAKLVVGPLDGETIGQGAAAHQNLAVLVGCIAADQVLRH
ncbi:MAG TPA: hypothetical protein VG276_31260 [Actinomycetes bacterium]|jgi:hypothetical protein|nr:hypothetical protein [Actinomycetes bacterium]